MIFKTGGGCLKAEFLSWSVSSSCCPYLHFFRLISTRAEDRRWVCLSVSQACFLSIALYFFNYDYDFLIFLAE